MTDFEPQLQQQTIKYKTYVKEALVQALRAVFRAHVDPILRETQVGIDFPFEQADYPAVVVRFYERSITNVGVGHIEHIEDTNNLGKYIKYKHYLYKGDIEFAIYALSSMDRDLISDSIVQTLAMGQMESYTNLFFNRIYSPDSVPSENEGGAYDPSIDHMINLNTDQISGFGETQTQVPWLSEDQLLYQNSYRVGILGEFYSRTPVEQNYGLIEYFEQYPYAPSVGDPKPDPNPEDPAPWDVQGPGAP